MEDITLRSVVKAKEELVTADMDGETVMMSVASGKYYNLGKMGGVIWGMLKNPVSVEKLIVNLLEKYDVTRRQCEAEVLSFLNDTYKEGLLEKE